MSAFPIIAIDPGNTQSGYCVIDRSTLRPLEFGKIDNAELLQKLSSRTACFGKNSVIWGMGERIDHAGIVLSGRVEAWRYTQDGQESLSAVHEAGGLFGDVLMSARTVGSPVELRTARPSKILFLSLDALLRCCAEDGGSDCTRLLSNLLEEISEKYWALQRHIRLLSIPDGRTRLEA